MASADKQFANRYAKALYNVLVSIDAKLIEKVQKELTELVVLSEGSNGVFFQSPLFDEEEKSKVLDEVFKKHKACAQTQSFVRALNQVDHMNLLPDIVKAFEQTVLEHDQRIKVDVTTAYALSKKDEKRIEEVFTRLLNKEILIETSVDENLIGGISANVDGVVYDASIQGYLNRLEKKFHA